MPRVSMYSCQTKSKASLKMTGDHVAPFVARFLYLTEQVLPRLEPHMALAARDDWALDLTDLRRAWCGMGS